MVRALRDRAADLRRSFDAVHAVEDRWYARQPPFDPDETLDLMAAWVRAQLARIGVEKLVIGVSGGVDSSLALVVAALAAPGEVIAYLLPCGSDPADADDGRALCALYDVAVREVDLGAPVQATLQALGDDDPAPLLRGNLASRLRTAVLYHEAARHGALVMGTGDLDEAYIGYSCKGAAADLHPITGLHKDEVRAVLHAALAQKDPALAERLAGRPASPGYWPGQDAEQELGLRYAQIGAALDVILESCVIEPEGVVPRESTLDVRIALARHGVSEAELLAVTALVERGYHKAFASPALHRPERFDDDQAPLSPDPEES